MFPPINGPFAVFFGADSKSEINAKRSGPWSLLPHRRSGGPILLHPAIGVIPAGIAGPVQRYFPVGVESEMETGCEEVWPSVVSQIWTRRGLAFCRFPNLDAKRSGLLSFDAGACAQFIADRAEDGNGCRNVRWSVGSDPLDKERDECVFGELGHAPWQDSQPACWIPAAQPARRRSPCCVRCWTARREVASARRRRPAAASRARRIPDDVVTSSM